MNSENIQSLLTKFYIQQSLELTVLCPCFCDPVSTICSYELPLALTKRHKLVAEMFKGRYASKIEFLDKDDFYKIFAKVRAQMKKCIVYNISAAI